MSRLANFIFDRQKVQMLCEKSNINQTYLAVDKFLLSLFSPRDEVLSIGVMRGIQC